MTDEGYQFKGSVEVNSSQSAETSIEHSTYNYLRDQLGWSEGACKQRVDMELNRVIPKAILDQLSRHGWKFDQGMYLEVGCGQGGMLQELLLRGADAYGVEPGNEFYLVARKRIASANFDPQRVTQCPGEKLPYPSNQFDYAISFQVLEHVPNPEALINEIYRVLKPGGKCFLSCENYLSFTEGHYRIKWFPLLPKFLGVIYLKLIGRDPTFLKKYVYYTTFPQILGICRKTGFEITQLKDCSVIEKTVFFLKNLFRSGLQLELRKPQR